MQQGAHLHAEGCRAELLDAARQCVTPLSQVQEQHALLAWHAVAGQAVNSIPDALYCRPDIHHLGRCRQPNDMVKIR